MKDNDDPYTNFLKSRQGLNKTYTSMAQATMEYQEDCERAQAKYLSSPRDDKAKQTLVDSLSKYYQTLTETLNDYTSYLFSEEKAYTYALETYIVEGLKLNVVARV